MGDNDNFCAACGTKYVKKSIPIRKTDGESIFDAAKNDLKKQRHSAGDYFAKLVWLAAIIAFSYFLNPAVYLCAIPMVWFIIRFIIDDIKRRNPDFYIIERECIEKCLKENDEDPDEWQLWFDNADGTLHVAITAEKEEYDTVEIGERFYLVFLRGDKTPSLHYRKDEWVIPQENK